MSNLPLFHLLRHFLFHHRHLHSQQNNLTWPDLNGLRSLPIWTSLRLCCLFLSFYLQLLISSPLVTFLTYVQVLIHGAAYLTVKGVVAVAQQHISLDVSNLHLFLTFILRYPGPGHNQSDLYAHLQEHHLFQDPWIGIVIPAFLSLAMFFEP
ncbi:hypothetical protein BDZ97DRAFT_1818906 [Flammula alnicola]|nr:hypothetical protein BDZ97DRAFT_1818906 [Flammula alnicola]